MNEDEKWDYINDLDEELLRGGAILSEWTTFLARDAETAFCSGAYLSSILACQAAVESHLRFDYFQASDCKKWTFFELIEKSDLSLELRNELHILRKFRNKWVHVNDPSNDSDLQERPEYYEKELEEACKTSIRTMLKVLYNNQFI